MATIDVKRVYDDAAGTAADGFRVFVDRLWPRGESKEKFHYDLWAKDVAPSTELREWFHADPDSRWDEFCRKYTEELNSSEAASELVETLRKHPHITLLFASRNVEHNNADVLADFLRQRL